MKRITTALVGALLLAALPSVTTAAVQQWSQTSCSAIWNQLGNPVPFACFAEDADFSGSKLVLTGSSDIANLGTVTHNPVGHCNPKTQFDTDNWNDCLTSVWGKLGSQDSLCLYHNRNFDWRFKRWSIASGVGTTTFYDDEFAPTELDVLSSIMLQQSGPQCS